MYVIQFSKAPQAREPGFCNIRVAKKTQNNKNKKGGARIQKIRTPLFPKSQESETVN